VNTTAKTPKRKSKRPLSDAELAEAETRHAAILALATRETICKARAAEHLLALKRKKLYSVHAAASIEDYAAKFLGYSPGMTRDLVKTAERGEKFPLIWAAFLAGEIGWTKARDAMRLAEATGDEGGALDCARNGTSYDLEQKANEAAGEPRKRRFVLELTQEAYADLEDGIVALRREKGEALTKEQAVVEIFRRARNGGEGGAHPTHRIAIGVCKECGKVERETSAGKVLLAKANLERAACSSELLDITNGPAELKRKIPTKVLNYVRARDGDRCVVPECPNRGFLEAHHEGGWEQVGHDPTKVYMCCTAHHDDRHAVVLIAVLEGSVLQFAKADGTAIGDPIELDVKKRGARSYERRMGGAVRDAAAALRKLELTATEVKKGLDAVLAVDRAEPWTPEELVREVLRRSTA
jgi:hypothetical protein